MPMVRVASNGSRYGQDLFVRHFKMLADEPLDLGGNDTGPTPFEYILAGLGSCKTITVKMYAERKGWNLQSASADIAYDHSPSDSIVHVELTLTGNLDDAQRQRLKEISDRCPVHKFLSGAVQISTSLTPLQN